MKTILAKLMLSLFVIIDSYAVDLSSPAWSMYRRSPSHDAFARVRGPSTNTTAWIFQADGAIYGSPVLGNGFVYFGTYKTKDGSLFALNASTGRVAWKFRAGGPIGSTPTLVIDEALVFFGANDGYLYALDALSGVLLWRYRHTWFAQFQLVSSIVYSNGIAYFGTLDHYGHIFALSATRRSHGQLWMFKTGDGAVGAGVAGSIALSNDVLFVGANDGAVHAINSSGGSSKWSFQTQGIVYSSPALSLDRTKLFVGSNDGHLFSLDCSNGSKLWSLATPGWVDSSPAIDSSGNVYISTSNGNGAQNYANLYKVNETTGAVRWQINLPGADGLYDPVVTLDSVCAGSVEDDGGSFSCWDLSLGNLLWTARTGGHLGAAAAVGSSGEMFIGDRRGKLFKFDGAQSHRSPSQLLLV